MISFETNRNSNLLKLILYNGDYDLCLNNHLIQRFINKMVMKNWKVLNNTQKEYKYGTSVLNISMPDGELNLEKQVFKFKHKEIIKEEIKILPLEYIFETKNAINFTCKKDYHNVTINNVCVFQNPNKKISVRIINDKKIEINLILDHERDVTIRLANEILSLIS